MKTENGSEKEEKKTLMGYPLLVKHPRLPFPVSIADRFNVTTVLHAHSNVPAVRAYSDKPLPSTPALQFELIIRIIPLRPWCTIKRCIRSVSFGFYGLPTVEFGK